VPEADPASIPRTGIGFDVHRFAEAPRRLFLGGVELAGERGLDGHSDGDVVCHALADALLGALALGDVGEHVPDTDPETEGIAGRDLLARVLRLLEEAGGRPWSFDVTVIADRPQISPVREAMRTQLATALGVPVDRVSVKATRPEGLGLQGDGIGCLAVAVVV
jgi:2-C-methyl-D-erythritol 2,4-cyclodiphosphate synthase